MSILQKIEKSHKNSAKKSKFKKISSQRKFDIILP